MHNPDCKSSLLKKSTIFSHRGLNRFAPENTMSAFDRSVQSGATWIETDVDIIADDTVIVMHDSTTDRTTNQSGSIYDLTRHDLDSIDAGSWFSQDFAGEKVPTLDDIVAFANKHQVNFNIELKANKQGKDRSIKLVEATIDSLAKLAPNIEIIVSCFSPLLLAELGKRAPQYSLALLTNAYTLNEDWLSVLQMCGATYLHPEHTSLTRDLTSQIREAGFKINPWTVNSMARANELINWGCTGIITDVADKMLA